MKSYQFLGLIPSLLFPLFAHAARRCSEISLSVAASSQADDIVLPSLNLKDPNFVDGLLNSVVGGAGRVWPLIPVGDIFNITAILCEPETYNDANAVQLLAHGATYNKLYWSGLGLPDDQARQYDWTRFANEKGYATLAIDRLGSGNSSHADPLLEVQATLEAEIIHGVVQQLRDGKIGNKKFSKVAYVGHSMGSLIGMRATQLHPQDFDAVILTGWSANFLENFPKIVAGALLPASMAIPTRFANLNPLYLVLSVQKAVRHAFYGPDGSFDPAVEQYNWDHRDAVGTGELVSILAGTTITAYAGPVNVIDGEYDAAFCSPGPKCARDPNTAPVNTAPLFPDAKNFTYSLIPNTGHCLNLHFSADKTFASAHDFLNDNLSKA
ncbi:alpha/beta-hydrolase [Penicillium capsulatum]|uniref:Alpha/beta-hydrolase n=1 Tax=Penicillium capsulatum TaxID=69766 RepID=A0A9W9IKU5_9EURO|nr:alpha/beta-hydrolase [Penicillium capsulatum]KAJ6122549.1 alpha/beta-hydrolase [Penicillium capsulatum]